MPPVATTEDYLDLVAGIETAVTEMGMPMIIEGETPPRDPRLNKFAVTPDPGVIEVNMHPSKSWDELVVRTTGLYEAGRGRRGWERKNSWWMGAILGPAAAITSLSGAILRGFARAAAARFAAVIAGVLAESSVVELAVQRAVHRADQPGAAH